MHNDVRAKGKGRSVQRRHKRLKFENVLTVVPLLFLAHTSIASLTDDSASKAAKIVVRHKIISVRAEGYVSQQSSTPESWRESSFHEWKRPRGLLTLAVKRLDRLHSCTALLKVCHHFLPLLTTNSVLVLFLVLCEVSVHVFVHVCIQAIIVTGLPWERFQILIFCVVVVRSFLFLPLLRHYVLLLSHARVQSGMNVIIFCACWARLTHHLNALSCGSPDLLLLLHVWKCCLQYKAIHYVCVINWEEFV